MVNPNSSRAMTEGMAQTIMGMHLPEVNSTWPMPSLALMKPVLHLCDLLID